MLSEDFSQVLSVLKACRDISLSVSTTHGSYRKPAPVSAHCEAVLWDRKQANRKCVKHPVPTPAQAKILLLFKVLWIFPKRRLDKYKKICPSPFHRYLFCQIISEMTWKYFPALLSGMLVYLSGAEWVRGLVSLSAEDVLLLNFTRQLFHPPRIFPLFSVT